eukprot:6475065-Amphidinium_carterae.2
MDTHNVKLLSSAEKEMFTTKSPKPVSKQRVPMQDLLGFACTTSQGCNDIRCGGLNDALLLS